MNKVDNAVAHVPMYAIAHMRVILMRDIGNLTLHNSTCISTVVDISSQCVVVMCGGRCSSSLLAMALAQSIHNN